MNGIIRYAVFDLRVIYSPFPQQEETESADKAPNSSATFKGHQRGGAVRKDPATKRRVSIRREISASE